MLLAWLGAVLALSLVAKYTGFFREWPPLFILFVLVLAVPVAMARSAVMRFSCPRCERPFFRRTVWYGNFFTRKCAYCGLPKWTEVTPGESIGREPR